MSILKLTVSLLLAAMFAVGPGLAAVGSWNGIGFTAWNGVAITSWNGTSISTGGGGGSPALIANVGTAGTANGVTSGNINTTGANLLIVNAAWYSAGAADVTLTDSNSNTWTALTTQASTLVSQRLYYCYGATVGSGHNFTLSATNSYPSIQVIALSNMSSSPLDQNTGSTTGGAWTTKQPGSITPTQGNTVVVVGLSFEANSAGAISIDGSYTISNTVAHGSGTNEGGSLAYQIFTSASAQNPTWTTASSSTDGATTIASFKY